MAEETTDEIKILTGNQAAALASYMADTRYVAGYPITPATQVIEQLSKFAEKDKKLKFEVAESEYSVMGKLIGASLAGLRTFTATSSHGLALMHELLHIAAASALPIVMAVANRSMGVWNIWSDQGDSLSQLHTGWIQLYCANVQEVFDSILLAFKIAENPKVLTGAMVCYDGFTISQTEEPIIIPPKTKIKKYLPELNLPHKIAGSNRTPFTFSSSSIPFYFSKFQKNRMERLKNALPIAENAIYEFEKVFGRKIALIVDEEKSYKNLAAENICVSMGGISGAIQEAIEKISEFPLSALKIRLFNPFPKEQIINLLRNKKKKIIIFDNSPFPALTNRIKESLYGTANRPAIINKTVGVGGSHEVSSDFLAEKIKEILKTNKENGGLETSWLIDPETKPQIPQIKTAEHKDKFKFDNNKLITPGHRACQGCGAILPMKYMLETLGPETIITIPACCWSIIAGPYPASPLRVMTVHSAFAAGVQVASGIRAARELEGQETNIVVYGGDGAFFDIGFGALSAAAEREEKIICVCYDNEAYMNTGVQRSGATPLGAFTETCFFKKEKKKDMMAILAAHNIPYAATASIAHREDFKRKIEKAKKFQKEGLCFIHVLAPCPTGWKFPPNLTIRVARDAVKSGIFPLYEIERGEYKLQECDASTEAFERYLSAQKRFKNIGAEQKTEIWQEINTLISKIKKLSRDK